MELLYLWIESHYTLNHCGLNFSNQYQFTETVDFEKRTFTLVVEEYENYIPDFFPENIVNLSAIIGANGSGKSNLLEFVIRLLTNQLYPGEKWLAVFRLSNDQKAIYHALFDITNSQKENEWTVSPPENLSISVEQVYYPVGREIIGSDYPGIPNIDTTTSVIFYNPVLDFKRYPGNDVIGKEYVDVSTNFLIVEDNKGSRDKSVEEIISKHRYKNVMRQFEFLRSNLAQTEELNLPDQVQLRFNHTRVDKDNLWPTTNSLSIYEWLRKDFGSKSFGEPNALIQESQQKGNIQGIQRAKLEKVKIWFLIDIVENFFHNLSLYYDEQKKVFTISQEDIQRDTFYESVQELFKQQRVIDGSTVNQFIDEVIHAIDNLDIEKEIDDDGAYFEVSIDTAEQIFRHHQDYVNLYELEGSLGFIDLNWRDISTGEKALLDLFSRLYEGINQLHINKEGETANIIYILIDEGEIGFHPQWQKSYILMLLVFLQNLSEFERLNKTPSFQVIVTSHSPFVVSDLPKSNIIFLKKEENGYSCVVDIESKHQTFGANIHELFRDSFFIQDGMIGEFAKEIITHLLEVLKDENDNSKLGKEKVKKLISIIGEPLIQERLWDMYFKKFGNEERIEMLEKEIEKLKNKGRSNND